ncbi:MAG: formate dehydrogenase accessory sulfurtransferase FdhD [Chitinophagaceae bacterium]|nr:formate dehydrogenase accessory sulfurtransferase FdhD [Chitinophagaceae bacterium]
MKLTEKVHAIKFTSSEKINVEDELSVEEIIQISINNEPYTITMRSPGDEGDLIRGILWTENVYQNDNEKLQLSFLNKNELGFITSANVNIPINELKKGIDTKRNLMSVTSCGMCGKKEEDLFLGEALQNNIEIKASDILMMFEKMQTMQKTFHHSGGSHASAAFSKNGKMLALKEDIGRHNAVDKVIGNLINTQQLFDTNVLLVSGRLSYEIISKCYRAKIPILAAVSAPSSMAVRVAEDCGISLLAFCRNEKATVYSQQHRIIL